MLARVFDRKLKQLRLGAPLRHLHRTLRPAELAERFGELFEASRRVADDYLGRWFAGSAVELAEETADYLVIGRPIAAAEDPANAAKRVAEELEAA